MAEAEIKTFLVGFISALVGIWVGYMLVGMYFNVTANVKSQIPAQYGSFVDITGALVMLGTFLFALKATIGL